MANSILTVMQISHHSYTSLDLASLPRLLSTPSHTTPHHTTPLVVQDETQHCHLPDHLDPIHPDRADRIPDILPPNTDGGWRDNGEQWE